MVYGAEFWATRKKEEQLLNTAEMRMLRFSLGKTKLDRIRNEVIRKEMGVNTIVKKTEEARLRYYGHLQRRDENHAGKLAMKIEVDGKRNKGRPKKRYKDKIKEDMKARDLNEEDVEDRALWRRKTTAPDPKPG